MFHKETGFTIIELLVSVTILGILIGFSIAGYSKLNQRQHLIAIGQDIKIILRDAQSRALAGDSDCSICDCTSTAAQTEKGWYVNFSELTFYGMCGASRFSSRSFTLPADILITPYVTPVTHVYFPGNASQNSPVGTICVGSSSLPDNYYRIDLKDSGDIVDTTSLLPVCTP